MKKKVIYSGLLPALLVFGLALAGCDHNPRPGGGGGVPAELVGKWYESGVDERVFEITSAGKFIVGDLVAPNTLDMSVSGKTVKVDQIGAFDYAIDGTTMTITNGTDAFTYFNDKELTKNK
jgi:hypothetical protein